jgi:Zn finger protein HypA/HybF involved in hydrogenase expression
MHELAIAEKIIDEAKKNGAKRAIKLEVGELCEVEAHEIKEVIERMTKWKVKTVEVEGKIKCKCGYEGEANIVDKGHGYCVFNCPECDSKADVLEGGEIKIIGVE